MILVTPEFTKSVLMARGFRDDHYVRLLPEGEGWAVFNDIPDKSVMLTGTELREAYAGSGFHLCLRRGLDREERRRFWNGRIFKITWISGSMNRISTGSPTSADGCGT